MDSRRPQVTYLPNEKNLLFWKNFPYSTPLLSFVAIEKKNKSE